MLSALSETFINNLDFCRTNGLIQENIRQFREVSLKPEGKISSRQSFGNKNLEIIHYDSLGRTQVYGING